MKLSEVAARNVINVGNFIKSKGGYSDNISIAGLDITAFIGEPVEIKGYFKCDSNELTNLVGAPHTVGSDFSCRHNRLKTLDGGPVVGMDYNCGYNDLTSLAGIQNVIDGNFDCSRNEGLKSLVGGPREVKGNYICTGNRFSSLEGVASVIEQSLDCCDNENLKSFHLIHKQISHMRRFYAPHHEDSEYSHVLGLLLIDGLTTIILGRDRIEECLNKHLANPNKKQRMLLAQQELIEMGFDKAAQL